MRQKLLPDIKAEVERMKRSRMTSRKHTRTESSSGGRECTGMGG